MSESNPFQLLRGMASGYALPRCLHVVADLGVADKLEEAPRTAADLAKAVGADPGALGRVLRLLAANGVFEAKGSAFGHSPASRLLRSDHPQSVRSLARMFGLSMNWDAYGALDYTVRTGRPAPEKVLPEGFWAHFATHPEESAIFNGAMAGKAQGQVAGIVAAYDFSGFKRIADIGGGRGHLLQAALASAPEATGVLFDLPHVIQDAGGLASERLTLEPGDFFKDRLPACDLYMIMEVIHDWGDVESAAILKAIRQAAPPKSTLLLIESIIPDDPGPDWAKTLDVHMLTLLGGKQRTRAEYEALLGTAGFALKREIPTRADISILEATVR